MSGWEPDGPVTDIAGDVVTLVEGSSFCVSDYRGDISSGHLHGVFYLDTRVVSAWRMTVDGDELDHLAVFSRTPYHATFVAKAKPRRPGLESTLIVRRERYVGGGMREDISVRNLGAEPANISIEVHVDADFADLFAVKEGRAPVRAEREVKLTDGVLEIERTTATSRRGVRMRAQGAEVSPNRITFCEAIAPKKEWCASVEVLPTLDGQETPPRYPVGEPLEDTTPSVRLQEWADQAPTVSNVDQRLSRTLARTQEDLGALRIFDPASPGRAAVAAGAPWFMALFGRDSLLTAYMALPLDQDLAVGTLQTLAKYQGREVNALTEEQPGRILHEVRFGSEAALALGGRNVYYGTADATPLFVVLLGELWRWGLSDVALEELLPHADRALDWVTRYGDSDADGFVEYQRLNQRGLRNQGWKDSWDGVSFADGRIAEPPIALAEVQGYVYAALLDRAAIARHLGDREKADELDRQAGQLKAAFNEQFWLPELGWFAVGLDQDKKPIDSLASNMGHCLWTGIVEDDKAAQVAEALMSDEMFSGWGVRTLGATMGAYNPLSYHNGSVWPHDNAIVAAGLMRYGFVAEAQRIAEAMFDAAECFDGRLPELFTGIGRSEFPRPVRFPTSCSPQAWAAATPLLLLRSLLRFDPVLPGNAVYVDPALPASIGKLRVSNVSLADARVTLSADRQGFTLHGLPGEVTVVRSSRHSSEG